MMKVIKQETLEEAGEKLYPNRESFLYRFQNIERLAFTEGAKWQQERMYSIIDEYINDVMGGCNLRFEEWFEQFKNK